MKKNVIVFLAFLTLTCTTSVITQNVQQDESSNYLEQSWRNVATRMPDVWYGSKEAIMVADSVLKYQTEIGGWPKNSGFHRNVNQEEMARVKSSGIGATFDNGATLTEMMFLAKIYAQIKDERYHESFMKAYEYIIKSQYPNGGWPQYYPYRLRNSAYSSHITYNDNAMVNVMLFLKDIIDGNDLYDSMQITDKMKSIAKVSFNKGIECILNTQIIVDGKPTVWCAQHDEFTLAPAKARSYELESFSGSESVGITMLLMGIENPSSEIIAAVKGSVSWFEKSKINGIRVVPVSVPGGKDDRVVVEDESAPAIWARFYDLETGKPYFCDRDGIKKNSLAEIGYDRRSGYSWYGSWPERVLSIYPEWVKTHIP